MEKVTEIVPPLDDADRITVLSDQAKASRGSKDFFFLMTVAATIAISGLIANSTAVVIGAMLVAPLMQPIIGLAMGIAIASPVRLRTAARSIVFGATTAVSVATVVTMLFPVHEAPPEVLARTSPNLLDLIVALAAGAAGSYGAARKSIAGALPGVAIAVALVPPLCVVGFGIGEGVLPIARGAFLLFLTNLAGIVLVSAFIFMLFGFRPVTRSRTQLTRWGLAIALTGLLALTVPLGVATFSSFQSRLISWRLHQATAELEQETHVRVKDLAVVAEGNDFKILVTILSGETLDADAASAITESLKRQARRPVQVELTVLQAQILGD